MSGQYHAVLISPDGEDRVSDFHRDTKEEVSDALGNMGSRWYFYPVAVIVGPSGERIVEGAEIWGPDFYIDTREYVGRNVSVLMGDLAAMAGPVQKGGSK